MRYLYEYLEASTLWFFGMFGVVTALGVLLAMIFLIVAHLRDDDWADDEELEELWT